MLFLHLIQYLILLMYYLKPILSIRAWTDRGTGPGVPATGVGTAAAARSGARGEAARAGRAGPGCSGPHRRVAVARSRARHRSAANSVLF